MAKFSFIKRPFFCILSVYICYVMQSSVFSRLGFGGIVPNLMMIVTAAMGFMRGETTGLAIGFACGLLYDIFGVGLLGFHALLYMFIGYVNGKFERIFYPSDLRLPLLTIVGSDIFYGLMNYVFTFMLRTRFNFSFYMLNIIMPEMIYTLLTAVVIYPVLLFFNMRLEADEAKRTKKFV